MLSLYFKATFCSRVIDSILDFEKLPVVNQYISKPKLGFYSRGCLIIERKDISSLHFEDRVVQPFYSNVLQKISIYAIDGKIEYATSCPSKLQASGWNKVVEYIPTEEECSLALKFTSHVKNGIIRLDLIRLASGEILLLEIEGNSPYLALPEKALSQETKVRALDDLAQSLRRRVAGSSISKNGL